MPKRRLSLVVLIPAILIIAAPIFAHHGRGATYDMKKQVSLKGVVTEVAWRNPHVAIYIDVKDADGNVATGRLKTAT